MKVFIIHGSYGKANSNWFPWLKTELEKRGHTVFLPQFPIGIDKQNLTSWLKIIEKYKKDLDGAVFFGHSLSPAFILYLLETYKAKACFFVSGFLDFLDNKEYDTVNSTFITHKFNWKKINENCSKFFAYYGDNDPYVPQESLSKFVKLVGVKPLIIKNGGHLNSETNYNEFPQLLNDFRTIE
ncbi:hypothetical protein HN924_02665 [Candidatus Woesearchaeota archaeon]|jgi:uncharacterized protein|nr:hypothetical protein [Candidatus Woesearchaeota archaeon]MBT7062844.1 hypothetical protein [Candidatus Woesearchaeota archaeon]MBT7403009.1 hypothetical protein [Candidatus Woesearchaeota archaeon]